MRKIYNTTLLLINQLLGSFKLLFPLLRLYYSIYKPGKLLTPQQDVCIVGPPRSANTFTTKVFRYWNPDALIAHHAHVPNQVLYAVQWDIPCAVLLRNPADSITSMLIVNNLSVHAAILSYKNFYNRIKNIRSQITVLKFEDIINTPNIIVTQLNRKFGTSFVSTPFTEQIRKEVFLKIINNPGRKNDLRIAIPDQKKDLLKNDIKLSVINHPHFHKALSVYDEWVQYTRTGN